MKTFDVQVTQIIKVTVDETKFDEEFMKEFSSDFFKFDTIEEHVEHLGQLYARGIIDYDDFIEGYGPAKEFSIEFQNIDSETEIV